MTSEPSDDDGLARIELRNVSLRLRVFGDSVPSIKESAMNRLLRRRVRENREFWLYRDLDLRIDHGERVGIIGLNGAGKSTLLKIICGIYNPTLGKVSVRGRIAPLIELGVAHEQQHQELLLTDIKHALFQNPLGVAMFDASQPEAQARERGWTHHPGGIAAVGHEGEGFAFDCEGPRHRVLLEPFALADSLVTNSEWDTFIADGGYEIPRTDGDLDPEGERRLSAWVKANHGHDFVFVTDYATGIRPFYHMRREGDGSITNSYDLLYNGTEISTGAQREHRVDVLIEQAKEKGIEPEELEFYLDFFRYGVPPHGGFGMGLARLLMLLLGESSIREVTFLFRGPTRLAP